MSTGTAIDTARRERLSATTTGALPAWPVLSLLWGFPVFWALGLTLIAPVVLGLCMVGLMLARRIATVMPGTLTFLVFLIWVLASAVMIDSGPRMLGYVIRFSILAVLALVLLYVASAPERLTTPRVTQGLTFVWFVVIIGGYLGVVLPEVRFTSLVGSILPPDLTTNEYVYDIFFPAFAEVQTPFGAPEPFNRPAAPFPYANGWGMAVVLLTPVVVARFLTTSSLLLRAAILAGAVSLVVPAVASSNRGMFLGLAIALGYVGLRMALRDRAAPFLALTAFGVVASVTLLVTGLREAVATRQQYSSSTADRLDLYRETIDRTLGSPLLGYGAPRPSLTESVSVGTQGYVWMLMFSYGFVGLGLFLYFLGSTTLRTRSAPSDEALCLHSVLVVACVVIFFYGLDVMQLLTVILVAAVLLRDRYVEGGGETS